MPKKPPKNAFYFYMVEFKEEQRKKGIHYGNMKEVADAAGPLWHDAPPSVRSKFEAIAKKEKEKFNVPEHKYTSNGISYAEIDQQARELQEAIVNEKKDIQNMVTSKGLRYSVNSLDIFVIDVNYYCKARVDYVIGESAVLRFNIHDGIREYYHQMINPGKIPVGYVSDVKYGSQELGLDMPDESKDHTDLMNVLANTIDYLKQSSKSARVLPALFTMPDKVAAVQNYIHQMCRRAGEDDSLFRVYQLDTLFFTLINYIKVHSDEGFPKESLALAQLKKDPFKYTPGIGCKHHEDIDKAVECCLSRVKRWAFTVLDSCCPVAGVKAEPGKHVPADFDLHEIQIFQEQKVTRHAPSVARAQSSCNTSVLSDYTETSNSSFKVPTESTTSRQEKRVHVPLRKPKTDYSESIRTPPELSTTEFPSLPVRAGRGRGMANRFDQMKLDD